MVLVSPKPSTFVDQNIVNLRKSVENLKQAQENEVEALATYVGDLISAKMDLEELLERIDHELFPFIEFPRG